MVKRRCNIMGVYLFTKSMLSVGNQFMRRSCPTHSSANQPEATVKGHWWTPSYTTTSPPALLWPGVLCCQGFLLRYARSPLNP